MKPSPPFGKLVLLGALLLALHLVLLFSVDSAVPGYVLTWLLGLWPIGLGIWFTLTWLKAREPR